MPQGTVDRFEGAQAVLEVDGEEVVRPRSALPPDLQEGDVIDLVTLTVDRAATEQLRRETEAANRLSQGKTQPPGSFDL